MPGAYGTTSGGQRRPPKKRPIRDTLTGRPKTGLDKRPRRKSNLKARTKRTVAMPRARLAKDASAAQKAAWKRLGYRSTWEV